MEFGEGGGITVSMPSIEELWSMFRWYHVFFVTGAYGFITHMKSLPAIRRFNKKLKEDLSSSDCSIRSKRHNGYELFNMKLFAILLLRSTLVLPWRLGCSVAAIIWLFISFLSSGVPDFRSQAMEEAWIWHMDAEELSLLWKTSKTYCN